MLLRDVAMVCFGSVANHRPANFDIEKCATQRNLTDRGEQQARKIGALFAARAAPIDACCPAAIAARIETARMAFEDDNVETFEAARPLSARTSSGRKAQNAAIMKEIRDFSGSGNLVLVDTSRKQSAR